MSDTDYVQGFIDRGEPIPSGAWDCPEGLTIPADYLARAWGAGRQHDAPGGYLLGEGTVRLNFADGAFMIPGYVKAGSGDAPSGPVEFGRDGCAVRYPHPPPLLLDDTMVLTGPPVTIRAG